MAWLYAIVWVGALVATYAMMPKPQAQPPPGVGEVKLPTIKEGQEIAVLFGTRDLPGSIIVWSGDLKIVALKKKGGGKK